MAKDKTKKPRVAQNKNGFEPKICAECNLPFEWRKKWEKCWDEVRFCSKSCKATSKSWKEKNERQTLILGHKNKQTIGPVFCGELLTLNLNQLNSN